MDDTETTGNQQKTISDEDRTAIHELADRIAAAFTAEVVRMEQRITARIDHVDEQIHELDRKVTAIQATIDEHRPLLDAFTGNGVRKFLGVGKKGGGDAVRENRPRPVQKP
jgi:DNA anti-recombination protein RmuC